MRKCVVNGWEKNKIGSEGQFPKILKQVDLPLVDHEEWQDARITHIVISQQFP